MENFLRRTWAEIDEKALLHNFEIIKQTAKSKICAVVKANAYGHGVEIVAPALQKAGADFFAVSNIEEAVELREFWDIPRVSMYVNLKNIIFHNVCIR